MVGLDVVGKTTIFYKMKLWEIVTTVPTIGTLTTYGKTNLQFSMLYLYMLLLLLNISFWNSYSPQEHKVFEAKKQVIFTFLIAPQHL